MFVTNFSRLQVSENTEVLRAARCVVLRLWEASVPSDLWEPVQYCMHCFALVCVTYYKDCPKNIESSLSLIVLWTLLSRPSMNHSWEARNQRRSLKSRVDFESRVSKPEIKQFLSHDTETWNLIRYSTHAVCFICMFIHVCFNSRMYCTVSNLQTENYTSQF